MQRILAVDVGSTTTKATVFEKSSAGWGMKGKATAPTTVEAPHLDVMIGVRKALGRLESRTALKLLEAGRLLSPSVGPEGVDLFVATSSAGGGLQMLVAGLAKHLTAESAHRAALGAGAVVLDVIAMDDARMVSEEIERIRKLRPDMILITGGTDGGNISGVAAVAEFVAAANPRPRFGQGFKVPVVFAGNVSAREYVNDVLSEIMDLTFTDNLRPDLEHEVLEPCIAEIHRLFLEHVMSHAPGYGTLLTWVGERIAPTPVAVGEVLKYLRATLGSKVLGVDVGGATTDVFSVLDGEFYRTVSANLGMSYSMSNVMVEARPENVLRWVPADITERELRDWNFNKMIRPTTLPQTAVDLMLEQALCREALRLSLEHHRSLVRGLKGIRKKREISDIFDQTGTGEVKLDMSKVGVIVGTGGAISYAPRYGQAMMMLNDGLQPEGVTDIYTDRDYLFPHIGMILKTVPDAARDILFNIALVPLGTVVAPKGPPVADGTVIAELTVGGKTVRISSGEIQRIPLEPGETVETEIVPQRRFDVGAGPGAAVKARLRGGYSGVVLDGRGRPIRMPENPEERRRVMRDWMTAMDALVAS
ncbi:MAG TPA: methylaspartate mutase [Firmicutes bacterium]|nr:methylaspartate mutase [Candidatus Fermentithermobacillaceae bacterium]